MKNQKMKSIIKATFIIFCERKYVLRPFYEFLSFGFNNKLNSFLSKQFGEVIDWGYLFNAADSF